MGIARSSKWLDEALSQHHFRRLSFEELEAAAERYDALVLQSDAIDQFCSSSYWVLSAYNTVMPVGRPWLLQSDHGYVALMGAETVQGVRVLQPLEAAWALASPLVGTDPQAVTDILYRTLVSHRDAWDVVVLSGIHENGPWFQSIVRTFAPRFVLRRGPVTKRHVARIDDGLDGFLRRRSKNFRRSLRKVFRRFEQSPFRIEDVSGSGSPNRLYDRLMQVERRSWKYAEGGGLCSESMQSFYRTMIKRMSARYALRLLFVVDEDGNDCAYILGGVFGERYRGLQFSYDEQYRDASLGNILQVTQIERLYQENIRSYDLGSDMDYKTRWGEESEETVALFVCKA